MLVLCLFRILFQVNKCLDSSTQRNGLGSRSSSTDTRLPEEMTVVFDMEGKAVARVISGPKPDAQLICMVARVRYKMRGKNRATGWKSTCIGLVGQGYISGEVLWPIGDIISKA